MSDAPPKRVTAGFEPVFVEVPIFDEGELLEAEQAYDEGVAVIIRMRSITRKLKRRIDAARARFSERQASNRPPLEPVALTVVGEPDSQKER